MKFEVTLAYLEARSLFKGGYNNPEILNFTNVCSRKEEDVICKEKVVKVKMISVDVAARDRIF